MKRVNRLFTHLSPPRDFTGGTLGLAWVASPSGASGGICEKYKTYTENLGGQRHSEKRSLNTGIITFLNYNSRVPPKVGSESGEDNELVKYSKILLL